MAATPWVAGLVFAYRSWPNRYQVLFLESRVKLYEKSDSREFWIARFWLGFKQ